MHGWWQLLTIARLVLGTTLGSQAFKRRVMVLGAGPRAARIKALADLPGAGFIVCGFIGMNDGPDAVRGDVGQVTALVLRLREHLATDSHR